MVGRFFFQYTYLFFTRGSAGDLILGWEATEKNVIMNSWALCGGEGLRSFACP